MKHWPFEIMSMLDGRPVVEVDNGSKRQSFVRSIFKVTDWLSSNDLITAA